MNDFTISREPVDCDPVNPEEPGSLPPPTSLAVSPEALTLKTLHERLQARGVEMSYKVLGDFMNAGDLATLLGASGVRNRLAFPPAAVDVFAEFLPVYREKRGRLPQAAMLLREFLSARAVHEFTGSGETLQIGGGSALAAAREEAPDELARKPLGALMAMLAPLTGLPAAMHDLAAAVREMRQGRENGQVAAPVPAPPIPDRLLTAEQAAELLACSPRSVSRYVIPVRLRTWRQSDVQRYIAGLEPKD